MAETLALSSLSGALLSRRDKFAILTALSAVAGLAWAYLALTMASMDMASAAESMTGSIGVPWTANHFILTLLMWAVMMVAMMLPSASPMVLTYAAVVDQIAATQGRRTSAIVFTAGYLIVWSGFSLVATALQWGLERAALLSPMIVTSSALLGGTLLIIAGLYQLSPAKDFCLKYCQSSLTFIASHWRPGQDGALRMGLRHGSYCVGCCWALMLLLFVGGVMNLLWVAAISIFVLLEKLIGVGTRAARWLSGTGLIAAGVFIFTA